MLGIVVSTVFLEEPFLPSMERTTLDTPFGPVTIFLSGEYACIPRHGADPENHILPHLINHRAHMAALRNLGVTGVIGLNSAGSLKKDLSPGTLVVPHDFIALSPTPTVFENRYAHTVPSLDETLRGRLVAAAESCGVTGLVPSGVYWQTTGPRFETKAEIGMMAAFTDIVGMTMASEAVVCCELGLPYASLCSIDNYAHGIIDRELSAEAVRKAAGLNARSMWNITRRLS
ncbi:MAG: MTAP family purine nucleoside phosphorylase [Syntrophales bacterium]|jgi:5'-methylthioadenosine phosphorylase|nr:MTAP family purine nucleoside phosphorylase [Syntrophales bacterium]MCK9528861.1 MTAP family purine nucleoside phosphorylase [Syntrophales bacterium]MDX9921165.1 MTAP family purine nucleoside phosphorylase [Syntrophales bacterium]